MSVDEPLGKTGDLLRRWWWLVWWLLLVAHWLGALQDLGP